MPTWQHVTSDHKEAELKHMNRIKIDESQTVAEFIETLKQFPQDLPIRIDYTEGTDIWVSEEFFDGDPANPNCPVIRAIVVI